MPPTSASITIDEWLAENNARIQKKRKAKRQKMIKRNLKLEKQRKKELENAKRLADDEASADEALIPALPRIGSRYPMVHTLTLTLWSAPASVSEVPGSLAPSYRSYAPAALTPPINPLATPIPAPAASTIDNGAAAAVAPEAAKPALKRQVLAQKKLQIDMVVDEEPLPAKRARKVVNNCEE